MATTSASLHKNRKSTLARIRRFLAKDDHFSTSNSQILMKCHNSLFSQIYSASAPVQCDVCTVSSTAEVFEIIKGSKTGAFSPSFVPVNVGDEYGPTWSTHLFRIKVHVPKEWLGKEVHLRWNSSSEALLIDMDGNLLQGFVPKHRETFTIAKTWDGQLGNVLEYFVEMACNGLYGALGEGFSIDPPNPDLKYKLKCVDVAVFEPALFQLYTDLELLLGISEEMQDDIRGFQALYAANEMINLIIVKNFEKANQIASKFFSEKNGDKAHKLVAMGHCHIDTAWLWTYAETKRKCARSWSSQIELLKEYPDIVFTCSQMQQLAWMKEEYPSLFERIREYVKLKRFLPVGGTWVEMDGLLPDGESFIRQFYFGQHFLQSEFGLQAKEFWLPDTFGYSGQIPQLMKHMGIERFLTQKISWNRVNKFPHHSFWWEGIDGSKVLGHFPPGDSYEMNGWVKEILKSVNNSEDKGRTNIGAYLYGLGDGGGGPTVSIIERLNRLQDVDGLPKIVFDGPDYFFTQLESDGKKLCKWVGELYLEMHNGTYTSQAKLKWYNRKLEMLIKIAELKSTFSRLLNEQTSNSTTHTSLSDLKWIDDCWKGLLLNQFHDVIPGSCIEQVVDDALAIYHKAFNQITSYLSEEAYRLGLKQLDLEHLITPTSVNIVGFNPLPWTVNSVFSLPTSQMLSNLNEIGDEFQFVILEDLVEATKNSYKTHPDWTFGNPSSYLACLSKLNPSGYSALQPVAAKFPVSFTQSSDGTLGTFSNGIIRLEFSLKGIPQEKLFFKSQSDSKEWEVFKDCKNTDTDAGMFYIYDDNPVCWDAWDCDDFHLETRQKVTTYNGGDTGSIEIVAAGPLVAVYKWKTLSKLANDSEAVNIVRYTIMKAESPLLEYITIVDWANQSHKFLRAEFPMNVLSREATFEIQYGHIKRPTHSNTSWDMAQVEVSGHKWVDVSQSDRGVSLINDSKYGFQVKENIVRLSLLRSPKAPDGNCDMHKHVICYAILPHQGSFQTGETVSKAYEFNTNYEFYADTAASGVSTNLPSHVITTSHHAVIPEVVKLGYEQPDKTICIRLYESHGGSAFNVAIKTRFNVKKLIECNGMEEEVASERDFCVEETTETDGITSDLLKLSSFRADFSPFQIRTFLLFV